jgi:hypothetical protein
MQVVLVVCFTWQLKAGAFAFLMGLPLKSHAATKKSIPASTSQCRTNRLTKPISELAAMP